jgi:hypothetical protein
MHRFAAKFEATTSIGLHPSRHLRTIPHSEVSQTLKSLIAFSIQTHIKTVPIWPFKSTTKLQGRSRLLPPAQKSFYKR